MKDGATKTVLIADDDKALTQVLSLRCRELGLEAITVHDGIHAYQAIVQHAPDLLILDVSMPTGTGLYLIEELAREQTIEPIPAIVLTGKSDEETIRRCEQLGVCYEHAGEIER